VGRSTTAALVPFKVKNKKTQEVVHRLHKDMFDDDRVDYSENGWTYHWDVADTYSYKNRTLYCDILEKGELKLFVVNESEWASGGANDYCIFSKDPNALLEFCKDFNIQPDITQDDIVQQTM
jgi:hypothetical protein